MSLRFANEKNHSNAQISPNRGVNDTFKSYTRQNENSRMASLESVQGYESGDDFHGLLI